jgi:cAMP-dependent protein kinase regulator
MARKDISTLRDEAMLAVEKGKLGKAVELYEELEELEPESAAWSKRLGETHRRAGDNAAAVEAFERAAEKFVQSGFLIQAIAVCRMILQIDPDNVTTVERLAALAPAPRVTKDVPREPAPESEPVLVLADEPLLVLDEPAPPPAAPLPAPTAVPRVIPRPPVAVAEPPAAAPVRSSDRPAPPRAAPPRRRPPAVSISPGSSLDSIELASVMASARSVPNADGSSSGITILTLDEPSVTDLSLAELELIDEAAPAQPKAPAIGAIARLALIRTPLFAELHPRVLEQLIPRMALVDLAIGETLFVEGDPGTSLYVISEGEVTVESGGNELARLGPGAFFGEIALVTDLPRSATVRALSPVQLLGLDRDLVRDAAAEQREVINVLLRFVRERLIGRMLRTSELFKPFADHDRAELSSRFEIVEAVPGARLIVEGERADGLYVMVAGRVDVTRGGDSTPITQLASGDVFGEMSLLSGGGSTANVITVSRVLALRMPARTFTEVIMTHPQVLAYLGDLADRRAPRLETTQFVDLHVDLL